MSTSLNTTLTTFDHLMQRFGVGETNSTPTGRTNAEPFRISDYGQTAGRIEQAARELTELLRTFDQTLGSSNLTQLSSQVSPVVQRAQSGGKEVIDYAFRKAILFVLVVLAATLIYRLITVRLAPIRSKNP